MKALPRLLLIAAVSLTAALSLTAPASATVFTTVLSGTNEVPPNDSPGTGTATVTLEGNTLTVDIDFAGLTEPATLGHIHCCTPPGANVGVAIDFSDFPNISGGNYFRAFDLTDTSSYGATFLTDNGGTAAGAQAAFVAGLFAELSYVNIHNPTFPGGEIRGQLRQVSEPAALGLMIFALAGLAMRRWWTRA